MAAAAVLVVGVIIWVVGTLESSGALSGSVTIQMNAVPVDRTKADHLAALTELAEHDRVALALVVPDRSGAAAAWIGFTFNGHVDRPAFWATATERPASEIRDESLWWYYSVGGDAAEVTTFLTDLEHLGFRFTTVTPSVFDAAVSIATTPPMVIITGVVALSLLIALGAESIRRAERQTLRTLTGWRVRALLARECVEIAVLTSVLVALLLTALALFLGLRGVSASTWSVEIGLSILLAVLLVTFTVFAHALCVLITGRADARTRSAGGLAVVTTATIVLAGLLVLDGHAIERSVTDGRAAERTLVDEAMHGDDIILGTRGLQSTDEERALGAIARRALRSGTARMAATNLVDGVLVVSGTTTPELEQLLADRASVDSPTLIVPSSQTVSRDDDLRDLRRQIEFGWEIDAEAAPRPLEISTVDVGSTAALVRAVDRWDEWLGTQSATWPDITVLAIPPEDVPAEQLATAAANGEVRFADRDALQRAIRESGLTDLVLTYDRVGAAVEAQLSAIRGERMLLVAGMIAGSVAGVWACFVLTAEHRVRTATRSRLFALVGRHRFVVHRAFVLGTAGTIGLVAILVRLSMAGGATPVIPIVVVSAAAGLGSGLVLLCCLGLTRSRTRTETS